MSERGATYPVTLSKATVDQLRELAGLMGLEESMTLDVVVDVGLPYLLAELKLGRGLRR